MHARIARADGAKNSLTEKGATVNGRGDTPNTPDMLTGSNADGTLATGTGDVTCGNWTSTATDGHTRLGHFDKQGGGEAPNSWNRTPLEWLHPAEPGSDRRSRVVLLLRGKLTGVRPSWTAVTSRRRQTMRR